MPYCVKQNILDLEMTEAEMLTLTDDKKVGAISDNQVVAAITRGDAEIDACCQGMYTVPFGPNSEVIGSDAKNYTCIMPHVAAAINQPITGANWATYWVQKGSAGAAWVLGTTYTAIPNIVMGWSATLAAFNLYRNRPKPATLIDRYNKVMAWLKSVENGERAITGTMGDFYSYPASTTDGTVQEFRRTMRDIDGNVVGDIGSVGEIGAPGDFGRGRSW